MEKKINVALIYRACETLTKQHYYTYYYHFFMNALNRNERLSIKYYETEEVFNIKEISDETDIIFLVENGITGDACMPVEIKNIDTVDIPVLSKIGDTHAMNKKNIEKNNDKYNITAYCGHQPEELFRKYYGNKFNFKTILIGLESALYQKILPFEERIKSKILNTGALAPTKFFSKLLSEYRSYAFWRDMKGNALKQYKLRTMCNSLSYVDYTSTLDHDYVGDKYHLWLEKYCASIAATTYCYTAKYFEIPAAGCLTFMEVTDENFARSLGFKDNESAIFINEKNYEEKFEEYLGDINNKKWKEIATKGRKHALNNLSNDNAVDELAKFMSSLIN